MNQISTFFFKRISLLIACIFISLTTLAQAVEICNNGIDDDGDKLVDCQDPDCPECARFINCIQPNTCYMPPTWGVPTGSSDQVFGAQDLVISTNAPYTTVTIRTADNSYVNTVAVTSSGSTIVSLPLSVVMTNSSGIKQRNKGLIITSGEPVQVTYRQTPGLNQDIVPLKCQAALGYAFYAGSQSRLGTDNVPDERHFVAVMATVDNTVVTFQSPISLDGASSFPLSVTLNAYETYLLASRLINNGANSENKSVSGVLVTSTQPIVVNSGSQHTQQPYSGNRDAGIDQLVPARVTGQDYVAIHGQNTTANADYVIIVGIENNTTVNISGPATTGAGSSLLSTSSLNAGQVFTYNLPNVVNRGFAIATSKKAYVYHVSSYAVNEFGMGILPTINPCNGSKRIDFFRTSSSSNDQAIVTIPSSGTASLTFRGQPFSTYGTVIDRLTVGGIPQTIISFPNASIAPANTVNTLTSTERFHVGVVSNTGGGSTGNYGYYSNYEAKVEVLNPDTGQPDDFYTVAQVKTGVANKHCLQMSSCGTVNKITGIINGSLTQSTTFDANNCITYTMKTSAPKCARDTIRVGVINELGKPGIICLEYVNSDNDLILNLLPSSLTICQPTGTVSLTAVPISSANTFNYQWVTPDKQLLTTQVISGTVSGWYYLSVTDANNCKDTASVYIQADAPRLDFTGGSLTLCSGITATYSITATAGTYAWSVTNGTIVAGGTPTSTTATVRWGNAGTGILKVTVTSISPLHCTASATQSVAISSIPSLTATVVSPLCSGNTTGSVDLTVVSGTAPFTYKWSNGATSEDLASVVAGVYSVTVIDKNGCIASNAPLSVTLTQPTALSVSITGINPACTGSSTGVVSLTATGGITPYSYLWNTGATTAAIGNVGPGSFSVTITDKNGCTKTASATLTQPPAITLIIAKQDLVCNGSNTGTISLSALGGTGAFVYRWSDGNTSRDRTGLTAGVYSVTATDASGCSAIASATIQQPTVVSLNLTKQNPACQGGQTGSLNLSVSGGTSPYTYNWSNGSSTEDLASVVAGVYSVTVTDKNGCTTTTSATLTEPVGISLATSKSDVLCTAGNSGTISVTASGGTGAFTFRWNDGTLQSGIYTQNRTGLATGTYSLTVSDGNNCIATTTVSLTQPATLTATISPTNPTCNGASTGQISLTASGGNTPYRFSWSTGATTQNLTDAGAGSYTLTITDRNNCTFTTVTTLQQPTAIVLKTNVQNPVCSGATTGSIALTATGGTGAFTYRWSTGATTQNLTGLVAAAYSLTVTDANQCTATTAPTVTQPLAISLSQTQVNVSCQGGADGRINLIVAGGSGNYTYRWSNTQTTQNIQALAAGAYAVIVTDATSCTAQLTTTIDQPAALSLTTIATNPSCAGADNGSILVTPAGGTAPYSYLWTEGLTLPKRTNLIAGVYSVTVTDANGCSKAQAFTLTQPSALSMTGKITNVSCTSGTNGAISLTVTGGLSPYQYAWSNGATTPNLTGLPVGNYSVTVTDANGCQAIYSATVIQPAPVRLSADLTDELCFANQNGTITSDVRGGTAPYTYLWSNNSTNASVYNLPSGTYSLTVTDANSCTASLNATITQPPKFGLNVVVIPVACNGASTGAIDLTVEGATPPYRYQWSTGATTEDISGLPGGLYSLTVTDANDCVETTTINIQESPPILVSETHTDVACFGQPTGTLSVTATGGRAPFAYVWNNAATTAQLTGLFTGVYALTVTDANGCSQLLSVTINQPTQLKLTPAQQNIACFGQASGQAGVVAQGGTSPYSYSWSNSLTTPSLNSLMAGVYSLTVADANGCSAQERFVISQPTALSITFTASNNSCFGDRLGSISLTVAGGSLPYAYVWSDGLSTTDTRTGLASGIYSITVTDGNGCSQPLSVTISEPAPLSVVTTTSPVVCWGDPSGNARLSVTGGTAPYTYQWNDGSTTADRTGLLAGTYSLTVTDANGCTTESSLSIGQPDALQLVSRVQEIGCAGGSTGTISLTTTGGITPYKYLWTDASTQADRMNLTAGNYQLTLTDANGCRVQLARTLTQPEPVQVNFTARRPTCFGASNGVISLTVTGGTLPYAYKWNTGSTDVNPSTLPAGVYSVTVTDANGCSQSLTTILSQPDLLAATATIVPNRCQGDNTGAMSIDVTGGTQPYAYQWATGQTAPSLTSLPAGPYSVTSTDANGCQTQLTKTITQPAALDLSTTFRNPTCAGATNGTISLNITGGSGQYETRWNDGVSTPNRTGLGAGVYSVTVTDGNQCIATTKVTLIQPDSIKVTSLVQPVTCAGSATGAINLTITGGTAPYTYAWIDGPTTKNRINLTAGTYTLNIQDGQGCVQTASSVVTQPDPIQILASLTQVACTGAQTGAISLTVSGGTLPYQYQWNSGQTTANISDLAAGQYAVTVTDGNGCRKTLLVTIGQPAALTLAIQPTALLCSNDQSGHIDLNVSGGASSYAYQWSNGATTQNLTNLSSGVYSVTVTDANGCNQTGSVTVTEPAALNVEATVQNNRCAGDQTGQASLAVTGGTMPYVYKWNTGASTAQLTNVLAGVYSVTVTDANNCFAEQTINLTAPTPLVSTLAQTNVSCTGLANGAASIATVGGTMPYAYQWNNGANTPAISNLISDAYSVTVTDANGCQATYAVAVVQPTPVRLSADITDELCFANQNATITSDVRGGTAPYTYLWSNNATNASVYNLPSGTYSLTVTDANSCTASLNATITQPPKFGLNVVVIPVACHAASTGAIDLTVEGATPPYRYQWSTGATTEDISGLPGGLYSLTVTDANDCIETTTINIQESPPILVSETHIDVACFGQSTGAISITATGGRSPFAFVWENGATTAQLSQLVSGIYSLTTTDANGCQTTLSVTINQPTQLRLTPDQQNIACFGQASGQVGVVALGGTSPYSYSWNNGLATPSLDLLMAGVYSVTVTDAYGCAAQERFVISQPTALSINYTTTNNLCANDQKGTITLQVTGGTEAYVYQWSDGLSTTDTRAGLSGGVYSVTVTDGNGCSQPLSITISEPAPLSVVTTLSPVVCWGDPSGNARLSVTGGIAPYTYQWNDGSTTDERTGLLAGIYSVTVTDAHGCMAESTLRIHQPDALQLVSHVQDIACADGNTGAISLTVAGGTGLYNTQWSDGPTTTERTGLMAGVYSVTVTDDNGCSKVQDFTLTQPSALSITGSTTNLSCNGGTNGAISLTVTGGISGYQYAWSNGATTPNLTGLVSNEYSLTVIDASGCKATFGAAVSQPTPVRLSADITDELCFSNQNGTITSDVRGGTAPYTYLWSNNSTNASVYNLPSGTYSLTVTDANSCTASLTNTINQPPKFGLNVVVIPVACHAARTGAIDLTVEGATPPYRYEWSTGATTEDISGLPGGLYSLTVTDANDCVETTTINVQESPPILLSETHTDVACFGQPTGAISVIATGGRFPFAYTWDNTATTAQLTDLFTGVYSLTATDANGCSEPLSISIGQPTRLQLLLDQQNVACFGGTDGQLSVVVQGGNSPYRYAWNTGATTTSISSLTAGVYSLTFTDTNACLLESRFVIFPPKALTVTHVSLNNSCFGEEFGAISLNVAGGKKPYTYAWSDGFRITDNRTGLASGTYSVTVTDANKCTIEESIVITAPKPLSSTLSQSSISCFGLADGLASLTISGGTPSYAYQWSNGASTKYISSLTAGPYSVTVSDDNGCSVVNSLTISEGVGITVTGDIMPTGCSGSVAQDNGRITLTNFSPGLRYVISVGSSFTGTVSDFSTLPFVPNDGVVTRTLANPSNPAGQPYTVRVFNATGCSSDLMVILPQIVCACQPVHVPFLLNKTKTGMRAGRR